MLSSITTFKRYFKAILNVFFNKNNVDDDNFFYLYDRFLVILFKIPGFLA